MILFRRDMAEAVLAGTKTVTRRRWSAPRVKVGTIHLCYTRPPFARPPGQPFARVRILNLAPEERPGASVADLSAEAGREGFPDWGSFLRRWAEMHGPAACSQPCWRVEFHLEEELRNV